MDGHIHGSEKWSDLPSVTQLGYEYHTIYGHLPFWLFLHTQLREWSSLEAL